MPFILLPELQEVSDLGCDVGLDAKVLGEGVEKMFEGVDVGFDWRKVDLSRVVEGWNSKVSLASEGVNHAYLRCVVN